MAYVGHGRLARAVSQAGGLGMIGIGSKDGLDLVVRETQLARGDDNLPFGVGLMAWALKDRPDLLQAVLDTHPFLVSISFGSPAPYADAVHRAGSLLATQVHSRTEAIEAAQAGADIIIAQGTEAGGHTGQVATLPLLQLVLELVKVPVLAAGGIGTPRGVAAALAAGAAGVLVGTCLLASPECDNSPEARSRVVGAEVTDTVLTRAFDVAQGIPWPAEYPGRALSNSFTERWHEHVDQLAGDQEARMELAAAISARNYDLAHVYAGQGAGMVKVERPAAEVIRWLGEGAEQMLRESLQSLLGS